MSTCTVFQYITTIDLENEVVLVINETHGKLDISSEIKQIVFIISAQTSVLVVPDAEMNKKFRIHSNWKYVCISSRHRGSGPFYAGPPTS